MDISRQEEIICSLWAIASIAAFSGGYTTWGWIFAIKSATDLAASIYFGVKEVAIKIKEQTNERIRTD